MTRQPAHGSERFGAIQACRGVAALLVVLYHGNRIIALPQYIGENPFQAFAFGHAGVDFFFVLSGFIITFVHARDIGRPASLARFAVRRLTRIYPPYWVVTAFVILISAVSPDAATRLEPGHVLFSILLIPDGRNPLIGVAWTLQHEMLFYVAFAAAIINRRLGIAVAAFGVSLIIAAGRWAEPGDLLAVLGSSYHIEFMMGVAAAWAVSRGDPPAPLVLASAGAIGFVLAGFIENAAWVETAGLASQLLFASASTALIIGLASAERAGRLRVGPIGELVGAASYSLYLVHVLIAGLTAHMMAWTGLMALLPDWLAYLVVVIAAVAVGLLFHLEVERRLQRWLRRITRDVGRPTPPRVVERA